MEAMPKTGKEGWERLKAGNARFASGDLIAFLANLSEEINPAAREHLLGGQKPFATILTCSDSRVAPEIIFDQGLGEIFVIRVAGNVLDTHATASIEYGVHHLGSKLLVIMGHQFCGAVTTAMGAATHDGNIGELLKPIAEAAEHGKKNGTDQAAQLEAAIQHNTRVVKRKLLESSPIIGEKIKDGSLLVVLAEYHMTTGVVDVIAEL